jgi:hypothetical protein
MSAPPLPEIFGNYALGEFVEVVPPDPVSWMPQTAGWLWLGLALLAILLRYGWKKLRLWYGNRYRREAVVRLRHLRHNLDRTSVVSELNRLLKLVALVAYSREKVARLSGESWAEFLNRQCEVPVFSDEQLGLLATGSYQTVGIDDVAAQGLVDASLQWVLDHRGAGNA